MNPSNPLSRLVPWLCTRGRWLLLAIAILAIPAAWRTAGLYLHLTSDLDALLPRDAPSVRAIEELRRRTGGRSYLGVVVDAPDASAAPGVRRLIDDLAERVKRYAPELPIQRVAVDIDEERGFFERHAGLYVDVADLEALRDRITARRDYEVAKQLGTLLDEEAPPPLGLDELRRKYEKRASLGRDRPLPEGRFESPDGRTAVLLVELNRAETGTATGKKLIDRVRADLDALGGPAAYAPGIRVGFAGDVAARVEELEALVVDLTAASILVLLAVSAVILLYYRWARALVVLGVPLLAGTVFAFALCTFPPLSLRALNSNTAFLGSIIVGNGVNTGIILLARYVEERRRGEAVIAAITTAYQATWRATLTAAAAAALAYGSLVFTQFRGFNQFGWIGALGMALCWVVTVLLVPPLVVLLDRGKGAIKPNGALPTLPGVGLLLDRVVGVVRRHPNGVLGAALVITALSLGTFATLSERWIETDYSQMRRRDTWTQGEGYWGRKMDAVLARYLTPAMILTEGEAQTRRVAAEAERAMKGPLSDIVTSVVTMDAVIPTEQDKKIALLREIDGVITPRMRQALPSDDRARLERVLSPEGLRPLTAADLPESIVGGMRDREGRLDRAVLVFPRPALTLWQASTMRRLTTVLRDTAARATLPGEAEPQVAGSVMLSYDLLEAIGSDGPRVTAIAFGFVLAVVIGAFGLSRGALLVAGSLIMAALWLVGVLRLFDVKLNFANFVAFPITFGIGADYAINVIGRYRADGRDDVLGAVRHTGAAVILASMTTVLGYSSLLLAKNNALFQFGAMAVLGELAAVTTSIVVLPSALLALSARPGGPRLGPLLWGRSAPKAETPPR